MQQQQALSSDYQSYPFGEQAGAAMDPGVQHVSQLYYNNNIQ